MKGQHVEALLMVCHQWWVKASLLESESLRVEDDVRKPVELWAIS